ncbi:MAG: xanthine dehydrogenase family protein molybdopterin-binding subunit, partial [Tepidisphaeraceae bacterium]
MPAATAPATPSVKGGIGTPIDRVDGRLKVTGRATYAAEAPIQGVAHAVLVSSVIAKGKIKSIDTTLARQQAGVLRVVTPKNVAGMSEPKKGDPQSGGGLREEERLPLDDWDITYAGQYVAAVVAETLEQARHAADLISIEYDSQTPVFQMQASGADSDKPQQDMGRPLQISKGDVAAVLKNAGASGLTVVQQTYTTPVETHNPMEMHATVAQWDGDDKLTVWDATQYIMGVRATLAGAFKLSESNVRVLCPFVGGGFGCKGAQWPHTILAAALAKMVKRPVKLMLTRQQMFTTPGRRSQTIQRLALGASKDGILKGIR